MNNKIQQATDTVVMISPDSFAFNQQTADSNAFQQHIKDEHTLHFAKHEFIHMVTQLEENNIRVITLSSRKDIPTPDAVFPNNWFSTHVYQDENILILYPMLAPNRRLERQHRALEQVLTDNGITINKVIDLSEMENEGHFLEGTGSLILDRPNHVAFASLSPRTSEAAVEKFIQHLGFKAIVFHAHDKTGQEIYHTNVVMSIGSNFAVIASESIVDEHERSHVLNELKQCGKEFIEISLEQMQQMAGNILELKTKDGKTKIVLSKTAFNAFTLEQRITLEKFGDLIVVNIDTIEKIGGGSARCMLGEVFYNSPASS